MKLLKLIIMIKKLMNISGVQVLSNEEMKKTKGGGWIVVCGDGQSFSAGTTAESALQVSDFMCGDNPGYMYCSGGSC